MTLTNAFGGVGRDFHASEALVDVANGIGATVIGFFVSLAARLFLKWFPAPLMYLGVGMVGALFYALARRVAANAGSLLDGRGR